MTKSELKAWAIREAEKVLNADIRTDGVVLHRIAVATLNAYASGMKVAERKAYGSRCGQCDQTRDSKSCGPSHAIIKQSRQAPGPEEAELAAQEIHQGNVQ